MDSRNLAKYALFVANEATRALEKQGAKTIAANEKAISIQSIPSIKKKGIAFERNEIYHALFTISPDLAYSYEQVKSDLLDSSRVSWAGTAHEVREIIANLLRLLAPDNDVKLQPWFKQDLTAKGITQTQRARYILQMRNQGSNTLEVVERNVNLLDERISELVRSTYNRASTAAHTYKDQDEVKRILGYFEALVHDLIKVGGK